MENVQAIITGGKDMYGVWIEGARIFSAGHTIEELKTNLQEAIALHIECDGEIPESMKRDYEIIYIFDISGFLKYYSQYISFAGMKKITGISQKQLWDYANGYRHPKKETSEKIINSVRNFEKDLSQVQIHF